MAEAKQAAAKAAVTTDADLSLPRGPAQRCDGRHDLVGVE